MKGITDQDTISMKCSMSDNLPPPSWCWCWPGPASWGSATHSCTCTRSCATACRRWCCEAEVSEVSEVSKTPGLRSPGCPKVARDGYSENTRDKVRRGGEAEAALETFKLKLM